MNRLLLVALLLASLLSSGCYYSHLARGQLKLLWAREPIESVLASPDTSHETRSLLQLVDPVRRFAEGLGLRVDHRYTSYVDWPDDRIVTTIVRARPDSIEAVPYWFPFVGALPYKGYFDRARAEKEAARLRDRKAYDVCISGVSAYSTLGWMDDPVTAPMLRQGAVSLVETLLHELVHATAFVGKDPGFSESVAQFIGQEASARFFAEDLPGLELASTIPWPAPDRVRDSITDRRAIAEVTVALRERLVALERDERWSSRRMEAVRETRAELAALPLRVLDPAKVASQARLGNACLALRGTYVRDLPRHAAVLRALDGDLEAMIRRLIETADGKRSIEEFYAVPSPSPVLADDARRAASATDELDYALLDESPEDL